MCYRSKVNQCCKKIWLIYQRFGWDVTISLFKRTIADFVSNFMNVKIPISFGGRCSIISTYSTLCTCYNITCTKLRKITLNQRFEYKCTLFVPSPRVLCSAEVVIWSTINDHIKELTLFVLVLPEILQKILQFLGCIIL